MAVETKSDWVTIRLTPRQAALIRECADREGQRPSAWLRLLALRRALELREQAHARERLEA